MRHDDGNVEETHQDSSEDDCPSFGSINGEQGSIDQTSTRQKIIRRSSAAWRDLQINWTRESAIVHSFHRLAVTRTSWKRRSDVSVCDRRVSVDCHRVLKTSLCNQQLVTLVTG